jgi:hypothetical protein
MNEIETATIRELEKDLSLRGYNESEITGLLETAFLLIPGPITTGDSQRPIQILTPHVVTIAKELSAKQVENQVVLIKGKPKEYIEERHAHVDLGAIIISLQQLGGLANLAQILDFLLNLVQLRFIKNRTQDLTPEIEFNLYIRNNNGVIRWRIKGPATELSKMTTPAHIESITEVLKD